MEGVARQGRTSARMTRDLQSTLERLFRRHFGSAADVRTVRAPGRVNLIGEHLDYNGLTVMPLTLEQGVTLVFAPRTDNRLRLFNSDDVHRPINGTLSDDSAIRATNDWSDLVRAAVRGLSARHGILRGLDGVVGADLPIAAGLSSSTALVVAVARGLLSVNRIGVDALGLIDCLSRAEQTVGPAGGAMDQAACIAGRPRVALRVSFEPLTLTPMPLPDNWRFVIAYSLVVAEKAGSVEAACTARIEQCRLILSVLQTAGVRGAESYRRLLASYDHDRLLRLSEHILDPVLRRRYRHLITESRRVREAEMMLEERNAVGFGRLMNDSQRSLCNDFEVSHPRLDRLVDACLGNGAIGARLTGAGFGGCVVALCDGSAESVMKGLRRDFYAASGVGEPDGCYLFEA